MGFHNAKIINDSPKTWDDESVAVDLGSETEINHITVQWGRDYANGFASTAAWTGMPGRRSKMSQTA